MRIARHFTPCYVPGTKHELIKFLQQYTSSTKESLKKCGKPQLYAMYFSIRNRINNERFKDYHETSC